MTKLWFPGVVLLICVAGALRLAGVYDDFWLDEIWTWRIAIYIARPEQILLEPAARWDNNHPLNTFLMWCLGWHVYWPVYRVPALAAGIASVALATAILRRRGRVEATVGALLSGFAYPLIHFSSEARGYGLAVFFALLGFDALERYLASRGWRRWAAGAVFVIACAAGFASHLTFFYFYAGAAVWSTVRLIRDRRGAFDVIINLLRLHALPLAALAFLYLTFVRHLQIGGAPTQRLGEALLASLGGLLGAGNSTAAAVFLVAAAAVLFVLAVLALRRQLGSLWVLLVTVVVAPVVVISIQKTFVESRQPIIARYFLVPFVFFLLGLALLLGDWLKRRDARRVIGAVLLAGFLALNAYHTFWFLRVGRGHYLDALAHMAGNTPAPVVTVLSDHNLRTAWVLDFYRRFLPPQQQLVIYDGSGDRPAPWTHGPPMWLIVNSDRSGQPPGNFQGFEFEREFPHYGLSGYTWYVYRNRSLPR